MKSKTFIIYILGAFIMGTILLIYIQYNSAKNIGSLISGNQKYLDEYKINSELKGLEKDVVSIESNISDVISTNDSEYIRGIETKIEKIREDLQQLQQVSDDNITANEIDQLDTVVQKKLLFSKELLDSFYTRGKISAEKLIGTLRGKRLMDSIYLIANNIENTRHRIITKLTVSNDKSGQKAQDFNTILIVLVLVCGASLFWYIINAVRKRESLIRQLDISEKQVRQSAQVKEKFMANMSHEIRTPMNAIIGFTNLLQHKQLDEEAKEYVYTIQKSGENLLTIINDILDLSKIEAGMMRIESTPFSLRALVHSIEMMFTQKAIEKQLQISTVVDESVPDTLEGDATRLTQILVNLIGNALKFTAKGSVTIKISNEGIADNFVNTGITITDTGIGVEKDKLQRIFDRFQQAEDSVTRNYGGSGLGLSIVYDLVMLQHGSINVQSEPGKGTSFKLMIPYKITTEQLSDNTSPVIQFNTQMNFENALILVVEDNEINQRLIKHLFKKWQLTYDLAQNGQEAIGKLQLKKYDLILMDIQMPVMDGYTAAEQIRSKLHLDTPIIAMTAHALAGEREKCLSYGINEYISKPIREEQLHKFIVQFAKIDKVAKINNNPIIKVTTGSYQYIDLEYLNDVSGGDIEFKKMVTAKFIESIPGSLNELDNAWQHKEITNLKLLVHNMKSTVSVMGLNELLKPFFNTLEYELLDQETFFTNFQAIKTICSNALVEAQSYLKEL